MKIIGAILVLIPVLAGAQIGGQVGYQSLNLTSNPRAAAMGGAAISLADGDLSQVFENPAVLDSVASQNIFVHFNPYFADVFVYSGAYSFDLGNAGMFAAGINYINYGTFNMTDETGNQQGVFNANDFTFQVGKAHQLGPFTLGASLKLSHSSIESFASTAILMDLGGIFRVNRNWTIALVMENFGARLSSFSSFSTPAIPFDVKIGTSFKPEYMPVRFTVTTTNIVDRNANTIDDQMGGSSRGIDRALQRLNVGAELLLSKHFELLLGYSHKRKQELKLEEQAKGAGFSYGLMVKVKRIELRFSRATYHAAGGSSFISLRTDLNDFKKIL